MEANPRELAMKTEILFLVESAVEGGFCARAVGASIFTEADTMDELRANIREAVDCHFEQDNEEFA